MALLTRALSSGKVRSGAAWCLCLGFLATWTTPGDARRTKPYCSENAPAAPSPPRRAVMPITAVHADPISGRIQHDLAIVSSLARHVAGQYVLVRVQDDAGRTGLGEASVTSVWSGETQTGTIALVHDVLAPL